VLHERQLGQVVHLLEDIQFHEPLVAPFLVGYGVDLVRVQPVDVLDVAQPLVDHGEVRP